MNIHLTVRAYLFILWRNIIIFSAFRQMMFVEFTYFYYSAQKTWKIALSKNTVTPCKNQRGKTDYFLKNFRYSACYKNWFAFIISQSDC